MRRFLAVVGALAIVVVVLAAVGITFAVRQGIAADLESRAFVDAAVPAIASSWRQQQLVDLATPELRDSVNPAELADFFAKLSALGSLIKYDGSVGHSMLSYFSGSDSAVTASYEAKAEFKNGAATFEIGLLKRNGRWMINGFHVNPDLKPTSNGSA